MKSFKNLFNNREYHKNPNLVSGFTLIEMIITAAIFAALSLLITSIFISIMKGQQRASAVQAVQENIRYAMDLMAKEMRFSQLTGGPFNGVASLDITTYGNSPQNIKYFLNTSDHVIIRNDGFGDANLTSSKEVEVTNLTFWGSSTPQRVTISISAKSKKYPQYTGTIRVQTSITPRPNF